MLSRVNKTYCIPIHDNGVYECPNSKFTVEYVLDKVYCVLADATAVSVHTGFCQI